MENISSIEPNLINKPQIGKGKSAIIYDLLDGTCYKRFYNYQYVEIRDQLEVLKRISNLELHNFCKIIDIIYDGNRVLGYTMVKYNDLDISILNSDCNYLITNYDNLLKDIDLLGDNYIIVEDFKEHNVMLTEDKIIIHDYDLYRIAGTPDMNKIINSARLLCLLSNLFYDDKHIHYDDMDGFIFTSRMYDLINGKNDGNSLKELLKGYKRPIDYIGGSYGHK